MRQGELQAATVACRPYDAGEFRKAVREARGLTTTSAEVFEPTLRKICAQTGVAVVFISEIPGTHIFGATRWLNPTKALIQLSLCGKSDDLLWFTFFHEVAHILLHGKRCVFIETGDLGCGPAGTDTDQEVEANEFACEFLIPAAEFKSFAARGQFDSDSIRLFARRIGIAPGIVVGRLQHERVIPFSHSNSLKHHFRFMEG
jgi:hypothetical protein